MRAKSGGDLMGWESKNVLITGISGFVVSGFVFGRGVA